MALFETSHPGAASRRGDARCAPGMGDEGGVAVSEPERSLAKNRAALLRREAAMTAELLDAWGLVWGVLADRLATLLGAIAEETARYALTVEQRVVAAQRLDATAGWREAATLLGAQGVNLAGAFDVLPVGAFRELLGALADG